MSDPIEQAYREIEKQSTPKTKPARGLTRCPEFTYFIERRPHAWAAARLGISENYLHSLKTGAKKPGTKLWKKLYALSDEIGREECLKAVRELQAQMIKRMNFEMKARAGIIDKDTVPNCMTLKEVEEFFSKKAEVA